MKLIPIPEAAERLALKESTVRRMILEKRITYVKIGRRSVRIPLEAIETLIQRGLRKQLND